MSILNVKNVPNTLVKRLKARADDEHRSMAQEVIHLLEEALTRSPRLHRVTELRGLGTALQSSTAEVQRFIERERRTWA